MKRQLMTIGIAAVAVSACALDNTVHNSFWDTRNYVNPAPSVARSSGSATVAFDLSGRSWRVAERLRKDFKSKPFTGFTIVVK